MINKAFLLGAGLGTRLRPMTSVVPKPLVPVHHRPLAHHTLSALKSAGITSVAINTHHLADAWAAAFPQNDYHGCQLTFFHEPTLLDTGGGIKNIAPFIGDDSILVMNGDILTDLDLQALIAAHEASGNVATLALRPTGDLCNVGVDGDRVTDMRYARGIDPGTHQFTGIYCITPAILDLIPSGEIVSIVPAFLELAARGELGAHIVPDATRWLDLGDRDSYLDGHRVAGIAPAIHPEAHIDRTAKILRSTIGPGCTVGSEAIVTDSVLWPNTHIGDGAHLERCIVYSPDVVHGQHRASDL